MAPPDDPLLADLTPEQREAVTTRASPLCIVAGAGSGKTRVLTRRIAWQVGQGAADPRRMLALTFTRRAAGELRARLRRLGLRDPPRAGTFTGYSALAVARELPPGARLVCCDLSEEWTAIARRFWERAGVADRIDLRIGPALDTLRALPFDPPVDLAFIDAAKAEYVDYYEELVPRLSERGVILVDNVLWDGLVADPDRADAATEALRAFSAHAAADPRTTVALLPVGDGLSMITRSRP